MKNIFAFFFLFISIHLFSNAKVWGQEKLILAIDFQDFFNNDTLTLLINGDTVFQDIKVTSDKSLGQTKAKVRIFSTNSDKISIIYNQKSIVTEYSQNIKVSVILNTFKRTYCVDPFNGIYIGFSKENNTGLTMVQTTNRFQYD